MKRDLQFIVVLLACITLVVYFIHHTRHGRYGLEAKAKFAEELALVELRTGRLESVRSRLRRDIDLLTPWPPDRDLTEELAQARLGYAYPEDRILIIRDP